MKRILLTLCVFIVLLTSANAGEYYNCVDRNGNTVITDNPQDGMKCNTSMSDDSQGGDSASGISGKAKLLMDEYQDMKRNKQQYSEAAQNIITALSSEIKDKNKLEKFLNDEYQDMKRNKQQYSEAAQNIITALSSLSSHNQEDKTLERKLKEAKRKQKDAEWDRDIAKRKNRFGY